MEKYYERLMRIYAKIVAKPERWLKLFASLNHIKLRIFKTSNGSAYGFNDKGCIRVKIMGEDYSIQPITKKIVFAQFDDAFIKEFGRQFYYSNLTCKDWTIKCSTKPEVGLRPMEIGIDQERFLRDFDRIVFTDNEVQIPKGIAFPPFHFGHTITEIIKE